jgi:hypothetical protein
MGRLCLCVLLGRRGEEMCLLEVRIGVISPLP